MGKKLNLTKEERRLYGKHPSYYARYTLNLELYYKVHAKIPFNNDKKT